MSQPAPRTTAATSPTRTLIPHEHGAYGQLIMPLVTALAIGRLTPAPMLLSAAVVLAFIAHESLLVVVGQRGKRALETDGPRARRLLAVLAGAAAATGAAGLTLAPTAARIALVLPAVLGVIVGWLVMRRLEKTLAGEIMVAAALSSSGLAVALAGGVPMKWALGCWMTWVLAFAAATLAVQVILVRARSKGRRDPGPAHAVIATGLLGAAFGIAIVVGLPRAAPIALAPTALLSITVCLFRFSPRRLRELGWALVGSSVLTMLILVIGLR